MKEIENNELYKFGISTKHNIMDNGERRFRLTGSDGSAYIRTEATSNSGWQNSHYHATLKELFLVQEGSVYFIELINGKPVLKKYEKDQIFFSQPLIPHNMYMTPNTITHTIKFGDCTQKDWIASPELDELIKTGNYIF